MHRRPLRTYGRKPISNRHVSSYAFSNYPHEFFDSNDSQANRFRTNEEDQSSINDPFETTFDRIAKNVKLPPMPPNHNSNDSILYVSSSSSSSLSDENWVEHIEKSPTIPPKKIIGKKRWKKIDPDKKRSIENVPVMKTQIANRKRPNTQQDINNSEVKKIESSLPRRKTRRAIKQHVVTPAIELNSDESDVSSIIPSPSTKALKSCCVEITRMKIADRHHESDEKSQTPNLNNDNITYNQFSPANEKVTAMSLGNQQTNNISNIKDCRIVLSRLDLNSVMPSGISHSPNSKMLTSSTPFGSRVLPFNLKPTFSPISSNFDYTNDELGETEIVEQSVIFDTTEDRTVLIESANSVNDKLLIKPSLRSQSTREYSQSDLNPSQDRKTKFPTVVDEKSTQLLFETNDDINNIDDITNSISIKSSGSDKLMDRMELKEIDTHPLSLLPEDNQSHSLFESTIPEISNVNNDSNINSQSFVNDDIFDSQKSSLDENEVNDKITNDDRLSEEECIESTTSLVNQTMNSITKIDSTDASSNASTETSNKDTSEDSYHLVMSNESSNKSSPPIHSMKVTNDKLINLNYSSVNKTEINDQISTRNSKQPFVLLTRLNNPRKITKRREKNVNWDRQLVTISESFDKPTSSHSSQEDEVSVTNLKVNEKKESITEISKPMNDVAPRLSRRTRSSVQNTISTATCNETLDIDDNRMVFLKPGKSWARSLSILNHINSNDDIEILSIGKGKKWRQSVMSVLKMQTQGVLQSCIKNKENENDERAVSHRIHRSDVTRVSSSTVAGTVESTSPGRFIRRISIRVVPENKNSTIEDRNVKDTSFLEVYGIASNKHRKTFAKKSTSLATRDVFVYNSQCANVDIAPILPESVVAARNVVLQRCNQTNCLAFEECYPQTFLEHCRKIGEGVYGEVFLFENKMEKSVIKIIPIEGEQLVNGEPQKKFCEILSEIIIAKELHNLRFHNVYRTSGFIEVKNIRCLIGKYPQRLIEHWQAYDEEKTSDNDCPTMFTDDQLYIALELGHGGQDLEAFVFQNATEAYTTFVQAALTLAVAEKSLDFEHRDLHWGNILISRTNDTEMSYKLDTEEIIFPCRGLKVAIIDFTLSRMSYQGCCMFNDLALDPALFTAVGEYQFEIYRLMKDKVGNNWKLFEPYTNILWLHYTLDKMITSVRYKKKTTKIHRTAILKLQELKDIILDYDSAYDLIKNCDKLSSLQRRSSCSE